jgi:hypothetical protein
MHFNRTEYRTRNAGRLFFQYFAVAFCLLCFGSAARAAADDGPMACVKAVTAPQFLGNVQGLPARVEVTVELGTVGNVASVKSKTDVDWIKAEMSLAFGANAQYLDECRGKTLQFVVSYVLEGKPTDKPISETTIRMPNEFVIRYHPMLPAK